MSRVRIEGSPPVTATEEMYRQLETGDILFFPQTPFVLTDEDRAFLLSQKQVDASYHKNISYRPAEDRLKGVDQSSAAGMKRMQAVMREYSRRAIDFTSAFLSRYAHDWKVDFASFRPIEENGRNVAQRSRNDLIHVDNFPTRPSHGDRLLRTFTNINPTRDRVWVTSDNFETLAWQYAVKAGLPRPLTPLRKLRGRMLGTLSGLGLPVVNRPPYDQFMLRFHHFLKENADFQRDCPKDRWDFPPNSTWIVFTDTASHSCLTGQFMLEQTFIVRRESLVWPEKAPIAILEKIAGFPITLSRAKSA